MTDDPTRPTPEDAGRDAAIDVTLPRQLRWVRCDDPWCVVDSDHGHRVLVPVANLLDEVAAALADVQDDVERRHLADAVAALRQAS